MGIQLPNHGRRGGELKCRVVDVGFGLANYFEKCSHKVEEVRGSVGKGVDVDGGPDLVLIQRQET